MPPEISAAHLMSFFPTGYSPYPEQREAILNIQKEFDSGKNIVAFQGPTGMGKTLIGHTFARKTQAEGGRSHYLTIQKNLQDQLTQQFPEVIALKGRSNYACNHTDASPDTNADNGVCRQENKGILHECVRDSMDPSILYYAASLQVDPACQLCPYWRQAQLASDANISAFTFSSFLYQRRLDRFEPRQFMIIDECHNIETELMKFITLELTSFALDSIGITIDEEISAKEHLINWIEKKNIHDKIMDKLGKTAFKDEAAEGLTMQQTRALQSLDGKIASFKVRLDLTKWIVETRLERSYGGALRPKIICRPLFVHPFAKDVLFSNGQRILCMSATILHFETWLKNLGLTQREVGYVEGPCTFPLENRPIFPIYAGKMGLKHFEAEKNPTRPKLMGTIRWILDFHKGQRGIVHCHSKKLAKAILEDVSSDRFLYQEDFPNEDKTLLLEAHKKRPDSVILAPAMHEGLDLRDDLSRFQVLAKVPYPDLSDKLISERKILDPLHYAWMCALKLVQSYGRSVRHKQDWAYTYVLDSAFPFFLINNCTLLPQWFLTAIQKERPKSPRKN